MSIKLRYIKTLLAILFIVVLPIQVWSTTYYVSPMGDNANVGNEVTPFNTIQKAADIMLAGDICRIHAGTYSETVIPAGSGAVGLPIVFEAYGDGDVIVDGADVLVGWTQFSGNIYRAPMNWDLTVQNQVFVNNAMAHLARWPNLVNAIDPFFSLNNYATPDKTGSAKDIIVDSDLPDKPTDFWKNAVLWADFGYKWSSFGTKITGSTGKTLNYSGGDGQHRPGFPTGTFLSTDKDLYFLAGKLELLDADNEWYYDPINKFLYIQVPGGGNPGSSVKAKKRQYAFDLNNKSYITVKGLKVFGSTIRMQNAGYCSLDGIDARYICHHSGDGVAPYAGGSAFGSGGLGIYISGNNNTIKNCIIKYSAGSGIVVNGDNHTVDNNDIQYTNYFANYTEAVKISSGTNNRITRNKIWNSASALISCDRGLTASNDDNALILYNDCGFGDRLIDDRGGINGNGYEVAYNWIHDLGVGLAVGSCGAIYSDNATDFATYHHNVIWNQANDYMARINDTGDGNDGIFIYNNTGYNIGKSEPVSREDNTIIAKNNFVNKPSSNFVNVALNDFRLTPSATAINQGEAVTGITAGYSDSKPDLGAYEYGGSEAVSNWKAGLGVTMYYNGEGGSVTAVNIQPQKEVLTIGDKRQLGAYTTPINTTNENVSWTSSNPAIATVSTTGLLTAIGTGESIIMVTTADGGLTGTCAIKVCSQNVALGKSVTASSQKEGTVYSPTALTDGKITKFENKWIPAANAVSPQWAEIDLGGNYTIGAIKFYSGAGMAGIGTDVLISDFDFQIGSGSSWQSVVTKTGNKASQYSTHFTEVNASKVRLLIKTSVPTGSYLRLFELQVFGAPVVISLLEDNYEIKTLATSFLDVFPNPLFNSDLSITLNDLTILEKMNVSISDIAGKLVYQKQLEPKLDKITLKISKNLFKSGIYFVKANNNLTFNSVVKLVVK